MDKKSRRLFMNLLTRYQEQSDKVLSELNVYLNSNLVYATQFVIRIEEERLFLL